MFLLLCFELHGWLPFLLSGSGQGLRASNLKSNFFLLFASRVWPMAALGRTCLQEEVKNPALGDGDGYYSSQRQNVAFFFPPEAARIILLIFQVERVRREGNLVSTLLPSSLSEPHSTA